MVTTRVEQNLRGARVVKAFAQEETEIARFDAENSHWFNLSARAAHLQAVSAPLLTLIANVGLVLVIWYGGLLVTRGWLTLGELVAFSTYLGQLVETLFAGKPSLNSGLEYLPDCPNRASVRPEHASR